MTAYVYARIADASEESFRLRPEGAKTSRWDHWEHLFFFIQKITIQDPQQNRTASSSLMSTYITCLLTVDVVELRV